MKEISPTPKSWFGLGFALVGTLPTDVSLPLLVYVVRGNVALATVLNAINTAVVPVLVPALFLLYTGVEVDVPDVELMASLPSPDRPDRGQVAIHTHWARRIQPVEPLLSATRLWPTCCS